VCLQTMVVVFGVYCMVPLLFVPYICIACFTSFLHLVNFHTLLILYYVKNQILIRLGLEFRAKGILKYLH
jgi:hypothetical protein